MRLRMTVMAGLAAALWGAACAGEGRRAAGQRSNRARRSAAPFVAPADTVALRGVYRRDRDQSRFRVCDAPRPFTVTAPDSVLEMLDANVDWHAPRPTTTVYVEIRGDTIPSSADTTLAGAVTVVSLTESRELASGECVPVRPKVPNQPPDSVVMRALRAAMGRDSALATALTVEFAAVWLNRDPYADLLVLVKAPPLCELAGCTLFAFEGSPEGYRFVSRTTGVATPVQMREEQSQGWQDVQVKVNGGAFGKRDVVLHYREGRYPRAANFEPPPGGRRGGLPIEGLTVIP